MTSCPRCQRTFDDGVRFCPVDGVLVVPAVEDRNLGQVLLGQFEVRDVCGRGAMGTVYRAYQRNMDRTVAVKILRRELLKEPDVVRRFLREARAAARLQHPNIVTVHMVGETDDGVPFLVMEHIDGVSLEAICEAQGPQSVQRVVALGKQIAAALGEAHHLGIVHRDLKPANILITDRSRTPDQVKVLDFGIAKIVQGNAPDESMVTRDGVIFGTPHYIAPEQATGAEIDGRADIYSLGVILFRLTTGQLPFEGTAGMQVVLKHLRDAPPKPRELEPSIPVALEKLILECLAKDRSNRPADAEAVSTALEKILAAAAVPASEAAATMHGMPQAPAPAPAPVRPARPAPRKPVEPARPAAREPAREVASREANGARDRKPENLATTAPRGYVPKAGATGRLRRDEILTPQAQPPHTKPPTHTGIYLGALIAVAVGAGAGVAAALMHNRVENNAPTIAIAPPPRTERRAPDVPPLVATLSDEHVLEEDGFILRAGFEHAPAAGQPGLVEVGLAGGQGPIDRAKVELALRTPTGTEERILCTPSDSAGQYRGNFLWRGVGRQKVSVVAEIAGRTQPLVLGFDVDARPGSMPPSRAARAEPRRSHKSDDDDVSDDNLPMTRVPPDPEPAPRLLAKPAQPVRDVAPHVAPPAPPRDVAAQPAPTPLVAPPPASVVPTSTTTSVIEHPKPAPPRRPRAEPPLPPGDEEPTGAPPPPAPDPTTFPAPTPEQ